MISQEFDYSYRTIVKCDYNDSPASIFGKIKHRDYYS